MRLVVDASAALSACDSSDGFRPLGEAELIAPSLMWSEARSSLHETVWRGETEPGRAELIRRRLRAAPIRSDNPAELDEETWRVAEELGWAKTYDAEYVALARLRGCRLVTRDARLRRGADRLGFVIGPAEL